jgi:hypothetical protein
MAGELLLSLGLYSALLAGVGHQVVGRGNIKGIFNLKVSSIVPEPYMDEIFHIPQARAYCAGKLISDRVV